MEIREKAMDANAITRAYFDEILIEMRHMDAVTPDTTLTLYGETFRTPIMMAALSHIKGQGGKGDGMVEMAEGARLARRGQLGRHGRGEPSSPAICEKNKRSIKIIKPYDDEDMVLRRIDQAEALGALAVGMDLDHSFGGNGKPDVVLGLPCARARRRTSNPTSSAPSSPSSSRACSARWTRASAWTRACRVSWSRTTTASCPRPCRR